MKLSHRVVIGMFRTSFCRTEEVSQMASKINV